MPKLSTDTIKKMLTSWITNDTQIGESTFAVWKDKIEEQSEEEIRQELKTFKGPKGIKIEDLPTFMKNQISNGDVWKRHNKVKLGEAAYDFFELDGNTYRLSFPEEGNSFSEVEDKVDAKDIENCWLRVFVTPPYLGDRYSFNVISTLDDTEIIGWATTED